MSETQAKAGAPPRSWGKLLARLLYVLLLALAIGAALGQCWWTLVIVAALSYVTVAWRLWRFQHLPA